MPAKEFGRALEDLCALDATLARKVREVVAKLDNCPSQPLGKELAFIAGAFGAWEICLDGASGRINALHLCRFGGGRGVVAVIVREHGDSCTDLLERDATAAFKRCAEKVSTAASAEIDQELA